MDKLRKSKAKNVNPITLFLIILISSFLVFLVNGTSYYALLGMSFVVVLTFSYLELIKRGFIYLGLYLLLKILAHIDLGMTTGAIIGLIALVLKLYPIFNVGRVLILTSPLKMMAALRKIHFPNTITTGRPGPVVIDLPKDVSALSLIRSQLDCRSASP